MVKSFEVLDSRLNGKSLAAGHLVAFNNATFETLDFVLKNHHSLLLM